MGASTGSGLQGFQNTVPPAWQQGQQSAQRTDFEGAGVGAPPSSGGKGVASTPAMSGQPQMGMPNNNMQNMANMLSNNTYQAQQPQGSVNPMGLMGQGQAAPMSQSGMRGNLNGMMQGQSPSGMPANPYQNTIQRGGWDNAQIGTQASGQSSGGKGGKGQSSWQPFNKQWTPPDTSNIYNNSQTAVTQQPVAQNNWESGHGGN